NSLPALTRGHPAARWQLSGGALSGGALPGRALSGGPAWSLTTTTGPTTTGSTTTEPPGAETLSGVPTLWELLVLTRRAARRVPAGRGVRDTTRQTHHGDDARHGDGRFAPPPERGRGCSTRLGEGLLLAHDVLLGSIRATVRANGAL
ncbi:MAG: hypothetical protein ACRYF3_06760, partial [Janthinobacterium lividum]